MDKSSTSPGPSHVVADQSEVAVFLGDPATFGAGAVERIDTHGAMVFLAGGRAYKVKRAVAFPYMDFSTLERRHRACRRELALNRRTAPDLYLGVVAIVRDSGGGLRLGPLSADGEAAGTGETVEWAVVMRRFRQEDLFDRLAEAGRLTVERIAVLGDEVRAFHDEAERIDAGVRDGGAARMLAVIEENAEEFAERPDLFQPAETAVYDRRIRAALEDSAPLLDRRQEAGFVRRCHGDLHLRNICLFDGRPTLFDAIEFNDAIACVDLLYDLAFLLMDLDRRGLAAEANLVLDRHLRDEADYAGLAALPLFLSCRAAIRAKVAASAEASQPDPEARARKRAEAQDYFRAASAYLEPRPAVLVAVGGLSGSGKSRLARSLAPGLGRVPGAVVLRSDVLRKRFFAVAEETRLPAEAYTPEAGRRVYDALRHLAGVALGAGQSVIVDAVHARPQERAAVEAVARAAGAGFAALWLEAPAEVLLERVGARRGDASDATRDVVRRQLGYDIGALTWRRLDAGGPPEAVSAAARRHLVGEEGRRGAVS